MTVANFSTARVVFLHDLDGRRNCRIFHGLTVADKFCLEMDYRNLSFAAVAALYEELMQQIQPRVLIGHGVGGYWALKMAVRHPTTLLLANPILSPQFRTDYPAIDALELNSGCSKTVYAETGQHHPNLINDLARFPAQVNMIQYHAGHHGLEFPETLNQLLQLALQHA